LRLPLKTWLTRTDIKWGEKKATKGLKLDKEAPRLMGEAAGLKQFGERSGIVCALATLGAP